MIPKNRLLLHSKFQELINGERINIVDVGAREDLFEPYGQLPKNLFKVYGFEPDREEAERLSNRFDSKEREYFPYGLWDTSTEIELSYAKAPGNSSIHPPNLEELKSIFPPLNWETRIPKEKLTLPVKALDDVHNESPFDCDLLKVDTQGSELEILHGAQALLKSSVSFVLLETWTYEVHKGQALSGKIMEWMHSQGFTLIRLNKGAEWERKIDKPTNVKGLQTLVGLDLLFVRNEFSFSDKAKVESKIIKAAAIAELYGFPDLAIQIIEKWSHDKGTSSKTGKAKSILHSNWSRNTDPIVFRFVRKIAWFLGYSMKKRNSDPYAPLH